MKHTFSSEIINPYWSEIHFLDIPGSEIFDFKIFLNSWYMYSSPDKYELSHILEHCLFEKNLHFASPLEFKMEHQKIDIQTCFTIGIILIELLGNIKTYHHLYLS